MAFSTSHLYNWQGFSLLHKHIFLYVTSNSTSCKCELAISLNNFFFSPLVSACVSACEYVLTRTIF